MGTALKSDTPIGIQVHVSIEQAHENNPHIFKFTYMADELKLNQWIKDHDYMMDGTLAIFSVKGIEVYIVGKAGGKSMEYKTSFGVDLNNDGVKVVMPLLQQEVTFIVHREPLSREEWNVSLLDPQAARPDSD